MGSIISDNIQRPTPDGERSAYRRGIIVGLTKFAYTHNGIQVVGNRQHPLSIAIAEVVQAMPLSDEDRGDEVAGERWDGLS